MNDDLRTSGRRSGDNGDYLTVREGYDIFTTKTESAALSSTINIMAAQVSSLPSRAEITHHWDVEAERYQRLETRVDEDRKDQKEALDKIDTKVDTLLADRLPKWVIPVAAIAAMIVIPLIIWALDHFGPLPSGGGT